MIRGTGSIPGVTTLPNFALKKGGWSRRSLTYWKQITKEQNLKDPYESMGNAKENKQGRTEDA